MLTEEGFSEKYFAVKIVSEWRLDVNDSYYKTDGEWSFINQKCWQDFFGKVFFSQDSRWVKTWCQR